MAAVVIVSPLQASDSASGMYVAVAVGPLGWHGGIKNSPYFAGLDALLWVDRLDGGGVVLRSCREREGGT
jgi:hypothetical protein